MQHRPDLQISGIDYSSEACRNVAAHLVALKDQAILNCQVNEVIAITHAIVLLSYFGAITAPAPAPRYDLSADGHVD